MMNLRDWMPLLAMPLMLLIVQILAILLASPMQEAGLAAFEDPTSVANPLIFIGLLLAFTLVMLFLIKKGIKRIIALFIGFSLFLVFAYIFGTLSLLVFGATAAGAVATLALSAGATALLYLYPEWYVIDVLGVLVAAGVASVFGISLAVIPVIILLILLAVYDAISVYRTKHMITLAEGVLDMKTPILVVVPKRKDYSFIKEGVSMGEGKERGAFIMGLGDLIMPSILVVSASVFLEPGGPLPIPLPAVGAIIGSLIGLAALLVVVNRGNPQAGLPPLNGGAIGGFLVGCAVSALLGWGVCI